ncbi:MAG TPA: carboxypeptidase-like regulatory domain-containing protein, partial [Daejeonella sp.]|nr:carboxypeptidase-like regulatory domain-containing protein [Daejeonella sp.]
MKKHGLNHRVLPIDLPKKFYLMLNWMFILTFLFCLRVSANSYSQSTKVSIDFKNKEFGEALSYLGTQGNIRLLFSPVDLPENRRINFSVKDMSALAVLEKMLQGTGLVHKEMDNGLVVISKPGPAVTVDIVVRGQVKDSRSVTLPGVSVKIKGTTLGTTTDSDGNYSLNVTEGSTLIFSYIGFITREVVVGTRTQIDVTLEEEKTALNEVVVVGYGTQKKANLTGSVDQISSERLENRPLPNLVQGLQGILPNVNIRLMDGRPNGTANINIRGVTSIGQGGSALILIDGVEGDPGMINPNYIASVSVLKDAASAAVYGA